MSLTCGCFRANASACSVAASVWAKVAPGGSVSVICVCDRSSGGMKAPGILPATRGAHDTAEKATTASSVHRRCFRHQAASRR